MILMLTHEISHDLVLIEDFEVLSLDEQHQRLADAETLRRERDERELYDLIRLSPLSLPNI